MDNGPDLYILMQRLQNCPEEFFWSPAVANPPKNYTGKILTHAIVNDLLQGLGLVTDPIEIYELFNLKYSEANINYLQVILISAYLLHDEWFLNAQKYGEKAKILLSQKLKKISEIVNAKDFVMDSERREELIRFCLKELDLKPNGETDIHSIDRLTTINSIERQRVIEESKAAQKRAQEIREAIARKEAEEAASKWNRE